MTNCKLCGRTANLHWLGKGDLCSRHFEEEYVKKNGLDEKSVKINKNFHEKEAKSKEKELLGKEVR